MDPIGVEEDRDAVTAFFRAQPLYFDGTRRSVYLDAWLHDMEQIFMTCHIEHHLRVRLAVRCLHGAARLWWIETGEREVPDHTWTQFYVVIRGRYGPLTIRRGLGAPDRNPEIYRVMRHSRYLLLAHAWQAYPGESMKHYGWRFREEMLPLIPQDLPDPDIEAQTILRNGVPLPIRQYVPFPSADKDIITMIDDVLQVEMTAEEAEIERRATQDRPPHQDEAGPSEPPRDEAGPSTPRYEVGPLEEEEEEPRYEVGPLLEEEPAAPAQEAEDPPADEEDLMPIDPPEDPPIPLIIISSDDEDGDEDDFGQEDEDEDPEEFPDEEDEDLEEEPMEIIPDEGDEHADEESDSDVSALTIELVF